MRKQLYYKRAFNRKSLAFFRKKLFAKNRVFWDPQKVRKREQRATRRAVLQNHIFPICAILIHGAMQNFSQIGRVVQKFSIFKCVGTTFFSYIGNQPPSASAGALKLLNFSFIKISLNFLSFFAAPSTFAECGIIIKLSFVLIKC